MAEQPPALALEFVLGGSYHGFVHLGCSLQVKSERMGIEDKERERGVWWVP
jgi:hypothetical protein